MINSIQIEFAINTVCREIWQTAQAKKQKKLSESKLWTELVCCILSSQVKYELAQALLKKMKQAHLLTPGSPDSSYEQCVLEVLKSPVVIQNRKIKYRFPNVKAEQISKAKSKIYDNGSTISKILSSCDNPLKLRAELVKVAPGIGMKQASMYLRNVSNSFELAVIDSHVLKYMSAMNLIKKIPSSISKARYLAKENMLTKYTERFGYPVGCVDYAIWIVMRVARKDGYL